MIVITVQKNDNGLPAYEKIAINETRIDKIVPVYTQNGVNKEVKSLVIYANYTERFFCKETVEEIIRQINGAK